ncbi:MAG: polysaccharide biosynthesis tyrosine autokinase [Clostridia bacterium]|nr:polysaccharide biosynthesis tyrosine autokinase [Clostridia bacterium]
MAYEEKVNYDDDAGFYSFLRLVSILIKKWWVVVIFMISFALLGFIFSRITYTEQYSSQIIFNVSNKDKDIAGTAATYITQSDAQASGMIAVNFKELIENGNDFITTIQQSVKEKTGKNYDKKYLRRLISVSLVTDGTLVYITVTSDDKDLSNAISTSIKDSYVDLTKSAFPTANFTIADNPTQSELLPDTSVFIYTIAGLLFGAILSVLILVVQSKIKNILLSSEDIKNKYGVNIMATVSKIDIKKAGISRLLITDRNVGLPFIETFKLIRTKLENVKLKKGYSVFAVTSSTESEGKTTCSANIALSLAKSGKSVILIDADLRRPAVCKTLGITLDGDRGIYEIVSGQKKFDEAVKYVERYNLYLLISDTQTVDPSEVLASKGMERIIEEARKNFDYVVVDCPPAGVVADAAIVANYADSIIFVASEGKVSLSQVEYALSDLMTTKSDILGCIYNYADPKFLSLGSHRGGGYFAGAYGGYHKFSSYGYANAYASSYYRQNQSSQSSSKRGGSK